ncbi:MAG: hypothetical protein ACOCZH_00875 [Phototrophicaceae bacterium]
MTLQRRMSNLVGMAAVLVAAALLLRALGIIPDGLYDVLTRAWPALLILLGLGLLLPERLPLASFIVLGLSGALVAGVAFVAYSSRADQPRDDQRVSIDQAIGDDVTLLVVNVNTLDTDVEVFDGDGERIIGEFAGGQASEIDLTHFETDDARAEFTLSETRPDQLPRLEAVGRATLRLELPETVALALVLDGEDGLMTLNLNALALERLVLDLDRGDALVTLPAYQPLAANAPEQPGLLNVQNGDLTVIVPPEVAMRIELDRGGNNIRPEFDDRYILIDDGADGTLEKRATTADEIPLTYEATVPRGLVRLQVAGQ